MSEDKNNSGSFIDKIDALPDADTHLASMIDIEHDEPGLDDSFLPDEGDNNNDGVLNKNTDGSDDANNNNNNNSDASRIQAALEAERRRADESDTQLKKEREDREKLEQENLTFRRAFATSQKEKYEESIRNKERDLVKAEEDGDSAGKVRLQGELSDLRVKKSEMESAIARIPDAPIKRTEQEKPKQDPNKVADRGENVALSKWRQSNPWFDKPQSEEDWAKRKRALDLDIVLRQQGKDHYSDDFYNQVNQGVKKMVENNNKGSGGNQRKSPVSGSRSTDAAKNNSNNPDITRAKDGKIKVKITPRDTELMQELGLDPNDPKTRQTFAMEKYKTAQRESRKEYMN